MRGGHVLPAFQAMERRIRLQADASHRRIEFLEPPRRADKSAAGSQARHKVRDAPLGLLPNFRSGGLVMRLPVGRVAVLVGVEKLVRRRSVNLPCAADGAVRSFVRRRQNQLGAIGGQNALALRAGVRRKAQLHSITQRRADHGVGDARIAAGRVQNGLARAAARRCARLPESCSAPRGPSPSRPD